LFTFPDKRKPASKFIVPAFRLLSLIGQEFGKQRNLFKLPFMQPLPFTSVELRKDLGIIFFRWLIAVTTEQFKAGYLQVLGAGQETDINCWLFDTRRRGAATQEAEAWYFSDYIPLLKTNLKSKHYIAVLHTPDHYVHIRDVIGFEKFRNYTKDTLIEMDFFDSEHKAVEWLTGSLK